MVLYVLMLGIALGIPLLLDAWACHSRWGQSSYAVQYGPVQGCLVRTPAGAWVPEDRVREIDMARPAQ